MIKLYYNNNNNYVDDFSFYGLYSDSCDGTDSLSLSYVIGEHVKTEMLGRPHDAEVSKNLINVRRKHVFIDGIKKIGRPNFNASLPLSVKFAGELGSSEGAVDLGGPTREFLRLAIQGMFSSNAFAGPANRKMLVLNQEGKPFLCPCSYSYYTWVDIYFVSITQSEWCCLKFVSKINLKKFKLFDHISNIIHIMQ